MGRGGYRHNAGRPASKGKADACMRLDVREKHVRSVLQPGRSGSWTWSNSYTGERTGSIGYRVEGAELVLRYSLNDEDKVQRVPILRTPCNYGATRLWFGCPHCRARVAVLYLRRGGFYCRNCARVAYYSQSEDECGRAWRKQQKAEAKLGENWTRPKGMHAATREKLLDVIFACEERRDEELACFLAAHTGLLDWP